MDQMACAVPYLIVPLLYRQRVRNGKPIAVDLEVGGFAIIVSLV